MNTVDLADAKARLGELVSRTTSGEGFCITLHGEPIAWLTPIPTPRRPIALGVLRALTGSMPAWTESAGDFVRGMREDDRY